MKSSSNVDTEELSAARQILNCIMSSSNANITFPFMDRIDGPALGLHKYDEMVRFPMWLRKISENFEQGKYPGIREFVCDFRLILVNCFRYNGVVSRMGRIAEKLELLFEQKLQLLSPDMRAKISLQASLDLGNNSQDESSDMGLLRRRSSTRLFGSSADSQTSHPIRALMEELEHSVPQDVVTSASFLYEGLPPGCPSIPVTNENSYALLLARLTHWQRKQHEEELISGWKDWWAGNPRYCTLQKELRKSPEFLEAFQMLWLVDPFLGLSDALAVATSLYHDGAFSDNATSDALPQAFVLPLSASSSSPRQLSLTELELSLSVAPQASLTLSTCVSGLLNSAKEREAVATAVAALSEQQQVVDERESNFLDTIGVDGDEGVTETTRIASRRIQSSHVATLKTFSTPPYEVWERRLATRLAQWYEEMPLERRLEESIRMERRFGVSREFFDACGNHQSPLEKQRFHELPVSQQAHILRALVSAVLLSSGNFGFSDNLRYSLDRSADWCVTRPSVLGEDPFSGISYFHFNEMLRGETPRIMQYRYPPHPDADYCPSAVSGGDCHPGESAYHLIDLPGPVIRLPTWMDSTLGSSVRSHLVGLVEREVQQLQSSAGRRESSKLAKKELSRAQALVQVIEPFLSTSSSKAKLKKRRKTGCPQQAVSVATFPDDLQVAGFAFINKISCGLVPLSVVYSKQGGGSSKSLRTVDSCASIAESVRSVEDLEVTTADSEMDLPMQEDSNGAPPLNNCEESESLASLSQPKNENSHPDSKATMLESTVSARLVLSRTQGTNEWRVSGARADWEEGDTESCSARTTPCRRVSDASVIDEEKQSERNEEPPKCNGASSYDPPSLVDNEKPNTEHPPDEQKVPDPPTDFNTVVYDLESFYAFQNVIASRVVKGQQLLQELMKASTDLSGQVSTNCIAMKSVINRIAEELGDAVANRIKADPLLVNAFTEAKEVLKVEDSAELQQQQPQQQQRPTRKRRRASFVYSRPKKSKKAAHTTVVETVLGNKVKEEEGEVDEEETLPARILRMHNEALQSLERLAGSLRELESSVKVAEPDRVAHERLAGLRLRKDIEAWEEVKKPKPRNPTHPPTSVAAKLSPLPALVQSKPSTESPPIAPRPTSAKLPLPPYFPRSGFSAKVTPPPVFIRQQLVAPRPPPVIAMPLPLTPQPTRRIFRFFDTLFTEDAKPVRLEANGAVVYIPPESVPLGHRQMAKQMIDRFRATTATPTASAGATVRPAAAP